MITVPDAIWSPDGVDPYALTTDLATMADTIQDAFDNVRNEIGGVDGRVDGLENDVLALDGRVDGVDSDLAVVYATGGLSGSIPSSGGMNGLTLTPTQTLGVGTSGDSFVVQKDGVYAISGFLNLDTNMPATTRATLVINVNGQIYCGMVTSFVGSTNARVSVSTVVWLSENDEVSASAQQSSGTSNSVAAGSHLSITRIPFQVP